MPADPRRRATLLVAEAEAGGAAPEKLADELMPLVYDELRDLAARMMRRERPGHTLQPTALVHEAYGRLVDQTRVSWRGRSHFLAVGAMVMRRILIDHARRRARQRRGGGWHRVTLSGGLGASAEEGLDREELLSLEMALERLVRRDPRAAKVVELRAFGGLTVPEVAAVLEVSESTVEGDWRHARAWLRRELAAGAPATSPEPEA